MSEDQNRLDGSNKTMMMMMKNHPKLLRIDNSTISDYCCFLIVCLRHQKILLTKNLIFLPCVPMNPLKTWHQSSYDSALQILLNDPNQRIDPDRIFDQKSLFKRFICLQICRFQLPQTQSFINRLIYLIELDSIENESISCCSNTSLYRWHPLSDAIASKIFRIWGPEVSYFSNLVSSNLSSSITAMINEYSLHDAFKHVPRETPITIEEQLLSQTSKSLNDIERLYADYIEHCFPSFFLTRFSFEIYLQKHQIETNLKVINRYYTAFRFRKKQYMHFHELLLGLASIDARASHEEFRTRLVFRYYDLNKDDHLNLQEFRLLLKDLPDFGHKPSTNSIRSLMNKIGTIFLNNEEMINFDCFRQSVLKGVLRGTERLCRSSVSPFTQIARSLITMKLCSSVSNKNLNQIILNNRITNADTDENNNGIEGENCCSICLRKDRYELSWDLFVLDQKGCMKNIEKLPEIISNEIKPKESIHKDFFLKNSLLIFILNEIHRFNKNKNQTRNMKGLFCNLNKQEIQAFAEDLKAICLNVGKIIEKEDRVLKLQDPIYVIGDIHGNLEDLMSMEYCLWRGFPMLTANYLFLGDYVDRGRYGFECFLYLIVMKFLAPKKIFLLRGNHEIRSIQMKYSFHRELIRKFGNVFGQTFFDLCNDVFDRLPCCAVINRSIFCSHGGLPYSELNLEKLNQIIPRVVKDPEVESIPLWEIVWSDPLDYNKFNEAAEMLGVQIDTVNRYFMPNVKRGTSYYFNEFAVISFFKENNLRFMMRAHEVPASGFKFNFGSLCTTIYSCSHFCGADNECAVILVTRESRMRIIRIDTSMNQPAT